MERRQLGQVQAEPARAELIQQINAGEVALLKGEKWQGNEGAGLIHRSPALAPGERRLILTLDLAGLRHIACFNPYRSWPHVAKHTYPRDCRAAWRRQNQSDSAPDGAQTTTRTLGGAGQ